MSRTQFKFQKPQRSVARVFIHCTASDYDHHDNVATIDQWHRDRGWSGIGYHFLIRKSGEIEVGRDLEETPAAQAGNNRATIAVALHGKRLENFTVDQYDALYEFCRQIDLAYDGVVTFHGHCEVANKDCPVIDYEKRLGLTDGYMLLRAHDRVVRPVRVANISGNDRLLDDADYEIRHAREWSGRPENGHHIRQLQVKLRELGYHPGNIDGLYGPLTRSAVLAFQNENNLVTDGVVGPVTRELLENAEPRVLSGARQKAGLAELAKDGSRIAQASIAQQATGVLGVAGGAATVLEQTTGNITKLTMQFGKWGQVIDGLGPWIGGGIILMALLMFLQGRKSGRARVEDHRTGRTL